MSAMWGIDVVVSDALPMDPSPGEWARRFVRHGMRDIVEWMGEEVGPEPDAQTHALIINRGGKDMLYASVSYVGKLKEACS